MSFFSENDEEKRLRTIRNNDRRFEMQRKKDKVRLQKRKEKYDEFQNEINSEVQRLIEENSPDKRKERLEAMQGSNLMKGAFCGGGFGTNLNTQGLRSAESPRGLMSLNRSGKESNSTSLENAEAKAAPKLSRPF